MKIKVLQVVTAYQSVVTILYSKLDLLRRKPDIEVEICSSFEDENEKRSSPVKHYSVTISRTINVVQDISGVIKLYKLIKKNNYDLIHTHTAKAGIIGAAAGFLAGVPVVHTYHGLPFYSHQGRITYVFYFGLEIVSSFLRTAVLSQNKKDYEFIRKIKLLNRKVIFEGNGVDIETIEKNASMANNEIDSFIYGGQVVIICVARFEPVKKIETVISAMEWLVQQNKNVKCIIAGKGIMENHLKKMIGEKRMNEHIKLLYTSNIHSLIKRADIFVLASVKEGIPRSVMEAMALSKPVVATDVLGTNELVVHEKTGILVPLGDQSAMNSALMRLIENKRLRCQLGENGCERIKKEFNEKKIVDLWEELYREIIINRKKSGENEIQH